MKELPRHEIDVPTVTPGYRIVEEKIETKKQLRNTKRWSGVTKKPLNSHDPLMKVKNAEFQATTTKLKNLVEHTPLGAHRVDPWKQEARELRGDLAGYWNDAKQELASRLGASLDPTVAPSIKKTIEWLEMAEREGGLSTWLDAWNAMAYSIYLGRSTPETLGGSWNELAEGIEKVTQGIDFCKEIIKDGLGKLTTDPKYSSLLQTLDAIGSEIARQAGEIIATGGSSAPPQPFDAIKERFKPLSERILVSERLHKSLEKMTSHEIFLQEFPTSVLQQSAGKLTEVEGFLKLWDRKADALRDYLESTGPDGNEELPAREISYACKEISERLSELSKSLGTASTFEGFYTEDASRALNIYQRLAEELAGQLAGFAAQCSQDPRDELLSTAAQLRSVLETIKREEPDRSIWSICQKAKELGKLNEFWINTKKVVDNACRNTSSAMYNPALADKFAEATRDELETVLASWTKRNDTGLLAKMADKLKELGIPLNLTQVDQREVVYTLGWQLIASLRKARRQSEVLLANLPGPLETVTASLDSIAQTVFEDLQESTLAANA